MYFEHEWWHTSRVAFGECARHDTASKVCEDAGLCIIEWLWLWLYTRPTQVPDLATSSVAPAPCSTRARPCLDGWWGEPFLVQRDAHFAVLGCAPVARARPSGHTCAMGLPFGFSPLTQRLVCASEPHRLGFI